MPHCRYCGQACQKAGWQSHKAKCTAKGKWVVVSQWLDKAHELIQNWTLTYPRSIGSSKCDAVIPFCWRQDSCNKPWESGEDFNFLKEGSKDFAPCPATLGWWRWLTKSRASHNVNYRDVGALQCQSVHSCVTRGYVRPFKKTEPIKEASSNPTK